MPSASKTKSRSRGAARSKNRIQLISAEGSTGLQLLRIATELAPELRDGIIAIDGEVPDESRRDDSIVVVREAPLGDLLARRRQAPLIRDDDWLASLLYPPEAERGAGGTKVVGTLKSSFVLDTFCQRADRAIAHLLRDVEGNEDDRLLFNIHLVAASCGGMGPAIIIPAALLLRDLVRRAAPRARCSTIAHLVDASLFRTAVVDPELRNKLYANDFGTFVEIDFACDPRNVEPLCRALDIEPIRVPTFDQLVPYHSTEDSGRSYGLEETLRERLLPNVVAHFNPALSAKLRERASNMVTMTGAQVRGPKRIVTVAQVKVAQIPPLLGRYWATLYAREVLKARHADAPEDRVVELSTLCKPALEIKATEDRVNAGYLQVQAGALTLPRSVRLMKTAEAVAHLRQVHDRFRSTIKAELDATHRLLSDQFESEEIPRLVAEVAECIVQRARTAGELRGTFGRLQEMVSDLADRAAQEAEKSASVVTSKRANFAALMAKLPTRALAGNTRLLAAAALNDMIVAEIARRRYQTIHDLVEGLAEALGEAGREGSLVQEAMGRELEHLGAEVRRLHRLMTESSGTVVSAARPAELASLVKQPLARAIRKATGSFPTLELRSLIGEGPLGVGSQVEELTNALCERYERYFNSELSDLAGAVKAWQLRFSTEDFIRRSLDDLACSSPVDPGTAGALADPQIVIVAAGRELEVVLQILKRNPPLHQVEVAEGHDARSITLHKRIDGLTVEALPTFRDGMRAAAKYPKPGTRGVSAWESLATSCYLLGAYERPEFTPPEWEASRRQTPRPPAGRSDASNDGVGAPRGVGRSDR
jgi:hypothetical protein